MLSSVSVIHAGRTIRRQTLRQTNTVVRSVDRPISRYTTEASSETAPKAQSKKPAENLNNIFQKLNSRDKSDPFRFGPSANTTNPRKFQAPPEYVAAAAWRAAKPSESPLRTANAQFAKDFSGEATSRNPNRPIVDSLPGFTKILYLAKDRANAGPSY